MKTRTNILVVKKLVIICLLIFHKTLFACNNATLELTKTKQVISKPGINVTATKRILRNSFDMEIH